MLLMRKLRCVFFAKIKTATRMRAVVRNVRDFFVRCSRQGTLCFVNWFLRPIHDFDLVAKCSRLSHKELLSFHPPTGEACGVYGTEV